MSKHSVEISRGKWQEGELDYGRNEQNVFFKTSF